MSYLVQLHRQCRLSSPLRAGTICLPPVLAQQPATPTMRPLHFLQLHSMCRCNSAPVSRPGCLPPTQIQQPALPLKRPLPASRLSALASTALPDFTFHAVCRLCALGWCRVLPALPVGAGLDRPTATMQGRQSSCARLNAFLGAGTTWTSSCYELMSSSLLNSSEILPGSCCRHRLDKSTVT